MSAQLKEEYFELPLPMKFVRALINTVATSFVWVFRVIITWASPVPSVASVIAAFALAALTRIKRAYSREAEPNQLPSPDERKLAPLGPWRKGE